MSFNTPGSGFDAEISRLEAASESAARLLRSLRSPIGMPAAKLKETRTSAAELLAVVASNQTGVEVRLEAARLSSEWGKRRARLRTWLNSYGS